MKLKHIRWVKIHGLRLIKKNWVERNPYKPMRGDGEVESKIDE